DSVLSAARLGLPTLSSFFVPVPELQKRHQVYRDAALAAGRSLSEIEELERRSWGMRVVHVAPDRAEALRAIEAPFMGYQRRMSVLRSDSTGGSVPSSFDRSLLRLRDFREYLADGWALVGTPDEVRDDLQKFREATGYERVRLVIPAHGAPCGISASTSQTGGPSWARPTRSGTISRSSGRPPATSGCSSSWPFRGPVRGGLSGRGGCG